MKRSLRMKLKMRKQNLGLNKLEKIIEEQKFEETTEKY